MGLDKTGRIGRIVDRSRGTRTSSSPPRSAHCYGPQQERGVYRTTDGGKTWERVALRGREHRRSDLAMDPTNPRILFAGMWQIDIKTWGRKSGGPGSGVFVSRDGGDDVEAPRRATACRSRRSARSPWRSRRANPKRVYALIETGAARLALALGRRRRELELVNYSRLLNERPHYYTRMLVMPDNENEVYFPSNGMGATYDGGETTESDPRGAATTTTCGPTRPTRAA